MSQTGPPNRNECAQRLAEFKKRLLGRPNDNNIEFWTNFVAEFFTLDAKKRCCISCYINNDDKSLGAGHRDTWNCELCESNPGYGYVRDVYGGCTPILGRCAHRPLFEITFGAMPRLFKAKYDSGISEELLHTDLDLPLEQYDLESYYTALLYGGTIKASVYEHGRVVHQGKLRITFSQDVKIFSWEFCSRDHEVFIPRRSIIPQVCELAAAMKEFIASNQNASSNQIVQDLQMSANKFVETSSRLEKALEVPELTCLGYKQSYVRCLQTLDTNCSSRMTSVFDNILKTGKGAMASYADPQKPEEKQTFMGLNVNDDRVANVASVSNDTMPPAQGNPSTHFTSQSPSSSNYPSDTKGRGILVSSAAPDSILVRNPPAQFRFPFLGQPSSSSNNPFDVSKSILASSAAAYNINALYQPAQFQQQPSYLNFSTGTSVNSQLHGLQELTGVVPMNPLALPYLNIRRAGTSTIQNPHTAFSTTPPAQRNSSSPFLITDYMRVMNPQTCIPMHPSPQLSPADQIQPRVMFLSQRGRYDLPSRWNPSSPFSSPSASSYNSHSHTSNSGSRALATRDFLGAMNPPTHIPMQPSPQLSQADQNESRIMSESEREGNDLLTQFRRSLAEKGDDQ